MSDDPPPISQADIDYAMANNERARAAAAGDEMLYLLGDGKPLWLVMAGLRADADRALTEFATANLGDLKNLQDLQSRVFCFQRAFDTFNEIVARGEAAKAALRDEEAMGR